MNKFKPFFIGAVTGAALLFVASQFHLVRSDEGFRLVPRTPQPSLGLAYVDVRGWTAAEWADRPEVARAMVADGSADLIASSVSDSLLDEVSEKGSALGQLRDLMNKDEPGGLLIPDSTDSQTSTDRQETQDRELRDLFEFRAPFDRDAKKPAQDRVASRDEEAFTNRPVKRDDLPTIDAIFGETDDTELNSRHRDPRNERVRNTVTEQTLPRSGGSFTQQPESPSPATRRQPVRSNELSASEEADIISDLLFGDDDDVATGSGTSDESGWQEAFREKTDRVALELKKNVSGRANQMAEEFQGRLQDRSRQAFDSTMESFQEEGTRRMNESLPESVRSFLQRGPKRSPSTGAGNSLPPELKALQDGFDPFVK